MFCAIEISNCVGDAPELKSHQTTLAPQLRVVRLRVEASHLRYCHAFATRATRFIGQCVPHRVCGNSGRSSQTVSMRVFVLHRFDVWVHPFTKSHRTW